MCIPLFGQIDIKGSSEARNRATQQDLKLQLNGAKSVIKEALQIEDLPIYHQFLFQIDEYLQNLDNHFQVDSEQTIAAFFKQDIEPLFDHLKSKNDLKSMLS